MDAFGFIGLTGGIAAGKSTVSKILSEDYNAIIIDADKIARELCEPGEIIYLGLKLGFAADKNPNKYFNKDGTLNRKLLAKLMFSDKYVKERIEDMMHRHIKTEMFLRAGRYFVKSYESKTRQPIIFDVPLLFEAKMEELVSKVIVVHIDADEQLKRLMERNGFSKEEALVRVNAQMDSNERLKRADYVINNNGTTDFLKDSIESVMNKLGYSKVGV